MAHLSPASYSLGAVELVTLERFATAAVTVVLEEIKFFWLISNLFVVALEILISLTHLWENFPISQYLGTTQSDGWGDEIGAFSSPGMINVACYAHLPEMKAPAGWRGRWSIHWLFSMIMCFWLLRVILTFFSFGPFLAPNSLPYI